jgi:hypothetical protein
MRTSRTVVWKIFRKIYLSKWILKEVKYIKYQRNKCLQITLKNILYLKWREFRKNNIGGDEIASISIVASPEEGCMCLHAMDDTGIEKNIRNRVILWSSKTKKNNTEFFINAWSYTDISGSITSTLITHYSTTQLLIAILIVILLDGVCITNGGVWQKYKSGNGEWWANINGAGGAPESWGSEQCQPPLTENVYRRNNGIKKYLQAFRYKYFFITV